MWINEAETSVMRSEAPTLSKQGSSHQGSEMAKKLLAKRHVSPVSSLSELIMLSDDDVLSRNPSSPLSKKFRNEIWESTDCQSRVKKIAVHEEVVHTSSDTVNRRSSLSKTNRRKSGIDFSKFPKDLGMGTFDLSSFPVSDDLQKSQTKNVKQAGGVRTWLQKANQSRDLICSSVPPSTSLPVALKEETNLHSSLVKSRNSRSKRASLTSVKESKGFTTSDVEEIFHLSLNLSNVEHAKDSYMDLKRRKSATAAVMARSVNTKAVPVQRRVSFNASSA